MKPETRLTNQIMKALKAKGGWWLKVHGGPSQKAGVPDIIGCYRGRFVAMEVKLPDGRSKLSLAQAVTLSKLRLADAHAYVVRSTLDALKILGKIDKVLAIERTIRDEPDDDGIG